MQLQLHHITQHYTNYITLRYNCNYNYNYTTLHYNTLDYAIPPYSTQHYNTLHYLHPTATTTASATTLH